MSALAEAKPETTEVDRLRVALELKHCRLRLEMALAEVDFAVTMLERGWIAPRGAISILNDAIDDFMGGGT